MNIVVCLKQTFDTEEKIEIVQGQIVEDGVKFVINPYDEYAVEEAIRQKEQAGGTVTVITVGPQRAESALRTALAMGADQAVHIWDERLQHADEFVISQVLAAAVRMEPFDLILTGYMAIDSGAAQGGPRLAELLDIPHTATAVQLNIDGDQAVIQRDVEGDTEVVEAKLPLLVTTQQGLNDPRYPSLPGIMKAKQKPLKRYTLDDLGLDAAALESRTQMLEQTLPKQRKSGRILQGSPAEAVNELVTLLKHEEKVI